MNPEEARKLLNAYVDGELDPATVLRLEDALSQDAALRATHERLRALSAAVREKADYHAAPAGLGAGLLGTLDEGDFSPKPARAPARPWLVPALALAGVALVAFALVLVALSGKGEARLADELFASHGRAALGARMIEIASADQHTVKPWLSARLPYSPPVADFAAQGFPLAGGRLDFIDGRAVAVLVYQRRKHTVEAFVWPGTAPSRSTARDGLNLESFSSDGMTWWLVSDVSREELAELARHLGRS